jgi:hypothetical protein
MCNTGNILKTYVAGIGFSCIVLQCNVPSPVPKYFFCLLHGTRQYFEGGGALADERSRAAVPLTFKGSSATVPLIFTGS